ncbi:hypothetical protein EZS27_023528 [termite gut metagenome]|uniref:Transcriptional regulator n=1 Tax=termite gut metagenome TaxID=433724 RepID=A0A5J4R182_9ZZZZ
MIYLIFERTTDFNYDINNIFFNFVLLPKLKFNTMKKQIILLFTLFTVLPVSARKQPAQLLKELDAVIADKEIYRENKEALLDSLKALATHVRADEQLYPVYESLCAEYFNYNVDSAFVYTLHKYELAQKINKPQLIVKSKIDLAHLYMLSGAYMAGLDMLQTISRQTIVEEYLPVYYHIYKTSYEAMAQECPLLQQKKAYMAMSALYRDSLRMQLQANDITLLFVTTEELTEKGACREALDVLLNQYGDEKTSTHEKAIVAYSIARAYRGLQHTDSAICYFAASAINDFKTPVKE